MHNKKIKAQQEMVGFVLIVVLVVVVLMVFLVISLRQDKEPIDSLEVSNILNSLMKYTTSCAIVFEPQYDNVEMLFKSCYENDQCSNLNKNSCDYLNETLNSAMESILSTEATISAYQIDFLTRDEQGEEGILRILNGNCTGEVYSSQRDLTHNKQHLIIRLKICKI